MPDLPIKLEYPSFNVTNMQNTDKSLEFCQAMKYDIGGDIATPRKCNGLQ